MDNIKKELLSEITQVIDMGVSDTFIEENNLTSDEPEYEYAERLLDEYTNSISRENNMRIRADFDNYKKRMEKSKSIMKSDIYYDIFSDMFDVLDDWDFFKGVVSDTSDKNISSGFSLIDKKMNKFLESNNVEKVDTSIKFDPDLHESITVMDENKEPGTILRVVSNGYKINGKIYKYPKVIVQK